MIMQMNIPNILTILRMLMIPVFAKMYYSDMRAASLLVFLLAGATDVLDGYLARKWNQITSFGKLMDPLADKLMTLTMIFCLMNTGFLPVWVFIVQAGKELMMVLGGLVLLKGVNGQKIIVMANWAGKAATALIISAIALVFPWHEWEGMRMVGRWMMYGAVGFSLFAMGNYTVGYVKKLTGKKED